MIIGIDLGTTNSLVSVWEDGKPQLIPNVHGEHLTPSVIGVNEEGEVLIGKAAKEQLVIHPDRTISAFKRMMGTKRSVRLKGMAFRPEELSALIIKSLKTDAESYLGHEITEAVISVPAFFNDSQRKATRTAGVLAGLEVKRLINEPTAAALAYGLHDLGSDKRFLVFDLGGGTFDVSILEMFDGVMEVHASAGDNFLGGEDFVDLLQDNFLNKNNIEIDALKNFELRSIRRAMEKVKIDLNEQNCVTTNIIIDGVSVSWGIYQSEYSQLIEPLMQKLRLPVDRVIRDSNLRVSNIDEIVLVGGATKALSIQKLVSRMFARLPLRQIKPDEVVSMGCSVQAGLLARDKALDEIVFTDVCPYSLGIETQAEDGSNRVGGLFDPLLERNTIIPSSKVRTYYPTTDYQGHVDLRVYQGESLLVSENILLGSLTIPLPKVKIGDSGVDIRFTYDSSGLLQVEAKVLKSGIQKSIEIQQSEGFMSKEEIADRLEKLEHLKIHPRDSLENQVVLNRAKHIYEELLGDSRAHIGNLIAQFCTVLEEQEPIKILRMRRDLQNVLDDLIS